MTWQGVEQHDDVVEKFRRALTRGRLASSFLFCGPNGVGKRTFALKLAQALNCLTRPEAALDPCGTCASCIQMAAGRHPDVDVIEKPDDKSFIPLELFIGERDHRRREGLCHNIGLKPFMGRRKIAIIDDADFLNPEGANCLLKTLEEPPPHSLLILIGTSPARQLPTIRSRCQIVQFRALSVETVAHLLVEGKLIDDPGEARRLARYSGGSLESALELADGELWEFRGRLFAALAAPQLASVAFAKELLAFVESAGKEAAKRRARLRQVLRFAADYYRCMVHLASGVEQTEDAELQRIVQQALSRRPRTVDAVAACLDACLETAENLARNANQNTLVEAWLDGLASG